MMILKTIWTGVVGFFDMLDDAMRFRNEALKNSSFRGLGY